MTILWSAFYFVIALGILVTIHEFGHFWVARKLGVKVLTFSVGFGKPLWQKTGKDGVNYIIAAIPLGGYVKMLDEREAEVAEHELPLAFNRKSVWARMAIVLAGPLANFILAIVFYWWMFVLGISGYSTQVGEISPQTIAGKAGLKENDVITEVDGKPVFLMQDIVKAVAQRIGDKNDLTLQVKNIDSQRQSELTLLLANWKLDESEPDILGSLGIRHKLENKVVRPEIEFVEAESPAEKSQLKVGDVVLAVNEQPINQWQDLSQAIKSNANQATRWQIQRDDELMHLSVVIGSLDEGEHQIGYLGIRPKHFFATRKGGLVESFYLAIAETGKMIELTMKMFKKLLVGDISPKSLSGPFSIAEGAGKSAQAGLVYFISFIAMISVNLGFINLLPVPLLDGGHLLYFIIEAVKGKPLSEKVQEIGLQIGMLMVFALMAIAIFNDISRF